MPLAKYIAKNLLRRRAGNNYSNNWKRAQLQAHVS